MQGGCAGVAGAGVADAGVADARLGIRILGQYLIPIINNRIIH